MSVAVEGNVSGLLASNTFAYTTTATFFYLSFTAPTIDTAFTIVVKSLNASATFYMADWSIYVGTVGTSLEGNLMLTQGILAAPTVASNQVSTNYCGIQTELQCFAPAFFHSTVNGPTGNFDYNIVLVLILMP